MKTKLVYLCSVLVLASLQVRGAVQFSESAITEPSDILNSGTLVTAINSGNDGVVANGISFSGVGFGFDPPSPPFDAQWFPSGDDFFAGFLSGPLSDPDLDALFANAYEGIGSREITLSSLIPGKPFRLQLFIADDSIASRSFEISLLGENFAFSRGLDDQAGAVVAEFVAMGTSETVTFTQTPGSNPVLLNAFAVHQVPEPSSILLVLLAAFVYLGSRHRSVVLILLLLPGTGWAGLEWEHTVREFRAVHVDESVRATFPFKNVGATAVTITSIRSSCGCTTASLEKRKYGPEETGEIVAEFRLGGRVGTQLKTVTVTTAEPDTETMVLKVKVHIQEPLKVQPRLVFWRLGEEPTQKQMEVHVQSDSPVHLMSVASSDPRLRVEIATTEKDDHYVLMVEPETTDSRFIATLTLKCDPAHAIGAVQKAFAAVR